MGIDVAACLFKVELGQLCFTRPGGGAQQVVDGRGQRVKGGPRAVSR
jgi:hypothetical protein